MQLQTIRTALGQLQSDPEEPRAWQSLDEAITLENGDLDESLRLLSAARQEHVKRREWGAVARLLATEVRLSAGSERELERLRLEAKTIREKYLGPPHTTDFALLFLPTEGLYAEALRRPGLSEALQREHKVMLVGPTTLLATLSSLQMGFRTLALEKRSAEVWEVLSAVKTEFGKFGDVLAKTKKKLEEASNTIDAAEVRTRAMTRRLKTVEALPEDQMSRVLQLGATDAPDEEGAAG